MKRTPGGELKGPETLCLQAARARLMCDGVLFALRAGELYALAIG